MNPGSVIGGCVVEQVLGRGGMGVVLRARDGGPGGRIVAVKVLLEGFERDGRKLKRFARELEATQALDHEGIVEVLRADVAGAHPWIVMELVDGPTLEQVFADPRSTLNGRLDLMEQVCHAVHHAHERGILHRDLKPQNVLVTRDGRAKVADFGLARDVSRQTRLTETGSLLGTPSYVAPECVRGSEGGVPADVWALGVMLYEAMAGRRPFTGASPIDLVRRIVDETPTAPSRLARTLTTEHDRVVLQALAKDPTARPASALELAEAIHALRANRRARGKAPRSPWLVALPVVAGVVLAAAAVLALTRREPPRPPPQTVSSAPAHPASEPAPPTEPAPSTEPAPLPDALAPVREALAAYDAELAVAAAERAVAGAPDSVEALLLRARARDLTLDLDGARVDLEQVVQRGAREHAYEARLLLASIPWPEGDAKAKFDHLSAAIALDPTRFEAYTRRGLLALYSGQKDGDTCRRDIAEAVRLAPRESEALRNAAVLAWDDQRRDPAADLYAQALAADPDDAEALDLRAWLHRDRGDVAAMKRDMADALARFGRLDDLAGHFVRRAREARLRYEADATRLQDAQLALKAAGRATGENLRHPLALEESSIVLTVHGLGLFESTRAEDGLKQALGSLDWTLSINERLWEAALRRAILRTLPWSGRDPRAALADVERVLEVKPDEPVALRIRADLRAQLGE